jgi:drug/metabolite transporter (DMT)-like permease
LDDKTDADQGVFTLPPAEANDTLRGSMRYLVVVSVIFAFSPGLIKGRLAGLDNAFVTAARLGLALLVFAPFLKVKGLTLRTAGSLVGIGAVQFGLMYLAYIESFHYLESYEVALFTITTPIFVTLFADALDRKLHRRALGAALLAVLGAAMVLIKSSRLDVTLTGLALVTLSNVAFAVGQVLYQRLRAGQPALRDRNIFGLLYAGGFIVAVIALLRRDIMVTLNASHLATLAYLGVIASGLGFFLWNIGATRVGVATLAVMNNAKVPLMIAASLLFFGERANVPSLVASFALMATAVWLAERK